MNRIIVSISDRIFTIYPEMPFDEARNFRSELQKRDVDAVSIPVNPKGLEAVDDMINTFKDCWTIVDKRHRAV